MDIRTNDTGSLVVSRYFQNVNPTRSATVALSVNTNIKQLTYVHIHEPQLQCTVQNTTNPEINAKVYSSYKNACTLLNANVA